jgi:hypothetical protein
MNETIICFINGSTIELSQEQFLKLKYILKSYKISFAWARANKIIYTE